MPIGVIVNCLSVLAGGLVGTGLKKYMPEELREKLPLLFGMCAMGIGIVSIVDVSNLTVVILSVLAGFVIGHFLKLENLTMRFFGGLVNKLKIGSGDFDRQFFATAVALFCCSGFGWYAALIEGISGDSSILFGKSVLDFFTALVFSASLGMALCSIPFPQALIHLLVFFVGRLLAPYLTASMFADLSACGGILTFASGFCVSKIKNIPLIDLMPALILVMPLSALWTALLG